WKPAPRVSRRERLECKNSASGIQKSHKTLTRFMAIPASREFAFPLRFNAAGRARPAEGVRFAPTLNRLAPGSWRGRGRCIKFFIG
ncbi:hypothetical protein, partial [Streptomyces sp. NPDC001781]